MNPSPLPPKNGDTCPATHKNVKDDCGCEPVIEQTYNAVVASHLSKNLKKHTLQCANGKVGFELTEGGGSFSSTITACVTKDVELDDEIKKKLLSLLENAVKEVDPKRREAWNKCYSKVLSKKKVQLNNDKLVFDIFNLKRDVILQNVSSKKVNWIVSEPDGYQFSPKSDDLGASESKTITVVRIEGSRRRKKTVAKFNVDSIETHEVQLIDSDASASLKKKVSNVVKENNINVVERVFEIVSQEAPLGISNAQKWMATGRLLFAANKVEESLVAYSQIKGDVPGHYYLLGKSQYRSGKRLDAVESFKKTAEKDTAFSSLAAASLITIFSMNLPKQCNSNSNTEACGTKYLHLNKHIHQTSEKAKFDLNKDFPAYYEELKSIFGVQPINNLPKVLQKIETKGSAASQKEN